MTSLILQRKIRGSLQTLSLHLTREAADLLEDLKHRLRSLPMDGVTSLALTARLLNPLRISISAVDPADLSAEERSHLTLHGWVVASYSPQQPAYPESVTVDDRDVTFHLPTARLSVPWMVLNGVLYSAETIA